MSRPVQLTKKKLPARWGSFYRRVNISYITRHGRTMIFFGIPAAISTVLLAPIVVLAFLGTGMQTFVLVAAFMALNFYLWADAFMIFRAFQAGGRA